MGSINELLNCILGLSGLFQRVFVILDILRTDILIHCRIGSV